VNGGVTLHDVRDGGVAQSVLPYAARSEQIMRA
jgi:hypothetical protein